MKVRVYLLAMDYGCRSVSGRLFPTKEMAEDYLKKKEEGIYAHNYIDEVTLNIRKKDMQIMSIEHPYDEDQDE